VGILGAIFITSINFFGIQMASRLQMFATLIVIIGGLTLIGGATFSGEVENFSPLFNNGPKGFLSVIIMVPFMFVGFDVIPQSAEEINLPFAQIGKAIMLSIITAILWYMLIIWSVSMGLESQQRELSLLPTAEASSALFNTSAAGKIIVIAGIGGLLTSWNAFLIGGSRALYALAQAGQLPSIFGELHPRYNTPYKAILLIGSLSIIAPLFGRPALVWLVDAGGLGIILAYIFVAISFLVLRVREPNMKRPFKVRNWRIVGGLALLLSCGILLLYLPGSPASLIWPYEWMIIFIWVLLGIFLSTRKRDDL
jgi:amino acid transporter